MKEDKSTRFERRMKIALLVQGLEDDYGSITKVPKDNPRLKELNELALYGGLSEDAKENVRQGVIKRRRRGPNHSQEEKKKVIALAKQGKSYTAISEETNISISTVGGWIKKSKGLNKPPTYNYTIVNKATKTEINVHGKQDIKAWATKHDTSFYFLIQNLDPSYGIVHSNKFWVDLQYGSLYMIPGDEHYYRKTDVESYGRYQIESIPF